MIIGNRDGLPVQVEPKAGSPPPDALGKTKAIVKDQPAEQPRPVRTCTAIADSIDKTFRPYMGICQAIKASLARFFIYKVVDFFAGYDFQWAKKAQSNLGKALTDLSGKYHGNPEIQSRRFTDKLRRQNVKILKKTQESFSKMQEYIKTFNIVHGDRYSKVFKKYLVLKKNHSEYLAILERTPKKIGSRIRELPYSEIKPNFNVDRELDSLEAELAEN